jgi:predicted porin
MKRRIGAALFGAGCAFASASSFAQSSVTLYGSVDGGVAYFNNVGGKSLFTSESGNYIPDMFGFRGSEDLGSGLHAVFNLLGQYSLMNGELVVPGQLFTREAMVGLASDTLGKLTLGHQTSFMFDVLSPYSTGWVTGNFYAFHQGNLDELANTFEFNNTVKYVSAPIGGLKVGAELGLGNTAGNFGEGRNYSFMAQYQIGGLNVGAAYADENNRYLEMSPFVGLKSMLGVDVASGTGITADNVKNLGVGGTYTLDKWMVHALFTQTRIEYGSLEANANTIDFGVNYTITPADTVGVAMTSENFDGGNWKTFALSNSYSLSKRTSLYQQIMFQHANGSNAVASILTAGQASGANQIGAVVGLQTWF